MKEKHTREGNAIFAMLAMENAILKKIDKC